MTANEPPKTPDVMPAASPDDASEGAGTNPAAIDNNDDENDAPKGTRLAKWIAQAGICSRREAEDMIAAGRVTLDDEKVTHPAVTTDDPTRIAVDGKRLRSPEAPRLWKLHKPVGVVVTEKDPEGRTTIYDLMPPGTPRLLYVGRLDINSEGLLLLTNNGDLKRKLELPATGLPRSYRVRLHGTPKPRDLQALADGLEVDGLQYGPIQAEIERSLGANTWLNVTLHEGKNREIRRVFEHLGYEVSRLIRVAYGPITLGSMPPRSMRELDRSLISRYFGFGPKRKSSWARAKLPDGKRVPRPTRSEALGLREPRTEVKEAIEQVERRDAAREEGRRRKALGLPPLREERFAAFKARHTRGGEERGERAERRGESERRFGDKPRYTQQRDDRGRDDRGRDDRGRDDRGRDDRMRRDGPRTDGPRGERFKSRGADEGRPRDERPRDERPGFERSGFERRGSERRGPERREFDRSGPERRGAYDRGPSDRGPSDRARQDRPDGERRHGQGPGNDRPRSERPWGDRPRDARPRDERSRDERSRDGNPREGRFGGERPYQERRTTDFGDRNRGFGERGFRDRERGNRGPGDRGQGTERRSFAGKDRKPRRDD